MNKQEVIDLMKSSKSKTEWNNNCDKVKRECGGSYPEYWYSEIILSGLINEIISDAKITIHTS